MQRAVLPGESSHSELVSESSTAGSNPLPLQTTVSSTRFAALPLSVQQLTNVASSMLGQAPQIVDSISPALQFSSIGSLVDSLNPPNAKQPRIEVPEQQAEPYDASADVDDDDEEKPVPKKTRGRVRIKMEYIQNKLRRYTTFSKRKSGLMKKAYELATLTGTQVMLLVASETGHVYTFATPKLQPMITSESGKALIQTCLNSPDPPFRHDQQTENVRFSQQGFEETELNYPPNVDTVSPKGVMDPLAMGPGAVLGPVVRVPFGMQLPQHQLPLTSQGGSVLFGQHLLPQSSAALSHNPVVTSLPPMSQPSSPPRLTHSPAMSAHSPPMHHRLSPSHTPYSQSSPMPSQPNVIVDDVGSPSTHMVGSPMRQASPPHFPQEHLLPHLDAYESHPSPHGSPLRQQTYSPMPTSRNTSPVYSNNGSPGQMVMGHVPMPHM